MLKVMLYYSQLKAILKKQKNKNNNNNDNKDKIKPEKT